MGSLTLKLGYCFQYWNYRKGTDSFDPRPLIFKLQQQDSKFNDICVSWSFLKTYEIQVLRTSVFLNSNF